MPFVTRGENVKKVEVKYIKKGRKLIPVPVVRSAIFMPAGHLFKGNKINPEGLITLLHEYSHIILSEEAKRFAKKLGLKGEQIDEAFADLLAHKILIHIMAKHPKLLKRIVHNYHPELMKFLFRKHMLERLWLYRNTLLGAMILREIAKARPRRRAIPKERARLFPMPRRPKI